MTVNTYHAILLYLSKHDKESEHLTEQDLLQPLEQATEEMINFICKAVSDTEQSSKMTMEVICRLVNVIGRFGKLHEKAFERLID